jgi:hypothetical protein
MGEETWTLWGEKWKLSVELLEDAEDSVEVKINGNTFQQKTRVRSQANRRWKERRWSGRGWKERGVVTVKQELVSGGGGGGFSFGHLGLCCLT